MVDLYTALFYFFILRSHYLYFWCLNCGKYFNQYDFSTVNFESTNSNYLAYVKAKNTCLKKKYNPLLCPN